MLNLKSFGGCGDAFIVSLCKLGNIDRPVRMSYWTKGHNKGSITPVLKLNPQVTEVVFLQSRRAYDSLACVGVNVNYSDGGFTQNPFPKMDLPGPPEDLPKEYHVVQVNGGTRGSNYKSLPKSFVVHLAKQAPTVLIGTDNSFYPLLFQTQYPFVNLIGRTTILEAMAVVARAKRFDGPEGLMFYVAMSQQVPALGYALPENMKSPVVRSAPEWGCATKVRSIRDLDKWR